MARVGTPSLHSAFVATPAHPDLQNTINDFSDYTEHFPADLFRSLKLIGNLDITYRDDAARVHDLTTTYSILPTLPTKDRPKPIELRKEISSALDHAIRSRHSALAEANRIYQVALRHKERISTIKRKLQAQPEPPSRDPTPPPAAILSPQTARGRRPTVEKTQRIILNVGQASNARALQQARQKARQKATARRPSLGNISPAASDASDFDSADSGLDIGTAEDLQRRKDSKRGKLKKSKTPRVRQPGTGTNVHSVVAGISTSNALAKLTPPPPDAQVGSVHKPWHKLTEYEMALLRKSMKKNAIWTPSETMIRRELVKHGRGHENFLKAKNEAVENGHEFLNEDPADPTKARLSPGEIRFQPTTEKEHELINRGMRLNEAKKEKKEKEKLEQAEMAREEARSITVPAAPSSAERSIRKTGIGGDEESSGAELDRRVRNQRKTNKELSEAAMALATKASNTVAQAVESLGRSSRKRKRDQSNRGAAFIAASPSQGLDETPGPKRLKIRVSGTSQPAFTEGSLAEEEEEDDDVIMQESPSMTERTKTVTTTTAIPLAPAGSVTASAKASASSRPTRSSTPAIDGQSAMVELETNKKPMLAPISTAASSRPRRGSATKTSSPLSATVKISDSIPASPAPSETLQTVRSLRKRSSLPPSRPPSRPRSSRGAVATGTTTSAGKAASAEPPASKRESRGPLQLRRGSNVSLPSTSQATEIATSSRSTRRGQKPPPGFVVEQEEGSGVGKVSRSQRKGGLRNRAGNKDDPRASEKDDLSDPAGAQVYCICRDVDYGTMIACDNRAHHDEWFHIGCVGFNENNYPRGKQKWYCAECQKLLKCDAKGNKA